MELGKSRAENKLRILGLILIAIVILFVAGVILRPQGIRSILNSNLNDATGCSVIYLSFGVNDQRELHDEQLDTLIAILNKMEFQYRGGYRGINIGNNKMTYSLVLYASVSVFTELGKIQFDENGYAYVGGAKYKVISPNEYSEIIAFLNECR